LHDIDTKEGAMKIRDEQIDRMLGYLGLFIIGVLGWTTDRLGELHRARPRVAPRPEPSHSIGRAEA
jgi:hypothetical protein